MEWRVGLIQPSISGDRNAIVRMIPAPFSMLTDLVKIRQGDALG
jgi:hypothetical protein